MFIELSKRENPIAKVAKGSTGIPEDFPEDFLYKFLLFSCTIVYARRSSLNIRTYKPSDWVMMRVTAR
jgi:hypothetical protein